MRVLVYPHDLGIGGSQINAIEIAAQMNDQGHEMVIFGRPGPLVARINELGLEFIASPEPRRRPSPAVMAALGKIVRDRNIQIIHGYEWPPAIEAWLVASRQPRVAAVATVMSMAVAPFLPRLLPLVVGTAQIADREQASGRVAVSTIEPPVDLIHNDPADSSGLAEFRSLWDLDESPAIDIVTVTRLAPELKLEGLLTAIDTLPTLHSNLPVRLTVVGGGPAEAEVWARAERANAEAGRRAVILTGELADPRPAYLAGDILLGMGSSALRALAFGKPLVVQGEQGFWQLLTPTSLAQFQWTGWYGVGPGRSDGAEALRRAVDPVISDPHKRAELGAFGRSVVEEQYALPRSAQRQLQVYEDALASTPGRAARLADAATCVSKYVFHSGRRKFARLVGQAKTDDFNSKPVAALGAETAKSR